MDFYFSGRKRSNYHHNDLAGICKYNVHVLLWSYSLSFSSMNTSNSGEFRVRKWPKTLEAIELVEIKCQILFNWIKCGIRNFLPFELSALFLREDYVPSTEWIKLILMIHTLITSHYYMDRDGLITNWNGRKKTMGI